MSEREPEQYDEDIADMDYDAQEAQDAEVNLDDPSATDNVPWTPPEQEPMGMEFLDDTQEETIDQRIAQEEPEEGTAYGAPESGSQIERDLEAADETDR